MPRRDILLDDLGNRVIAAGGYAFADGGQAVKQGIWCAVGLWLGENWLNQAEGVDYLGKILIKGPVPMVVKGEIASAIASVADVTRVANTGYSVDGRTRKASISYKVASTAGIVEGTV